MIPYHPLLDNCFRTNFFYNNIIQVSFNKIDNTKYLYDFFPWRNEQLIKQTN